MTVAEQQHDEDVHGSKARIEAFSDGVFAIIITIMVLELAAPRSSDPAALVPLLPKFASYALSFFYVAFYWVSHRHLLNVVRLISHRVVWLNMILLFLLSVIPFATDWLGETNGAAGPTFVYGITLLAAALAFACLQAVILAEIAHDHPLAHFAVDGRSQKSFFGYIVGLCLSFYAPWAAQILFLGIAFMWALPNPHLPRT